MKTIQFPMAEAKQKIKIWKMLIAKLGLLIVSSKFKMSKTKVLVNLILQIHKVINRKVLIIQHKVKIALLHRNLANKLMNNKMKRKKIQAIPVAVLKVNLKIKNKMLVKMMMIILKNKTKRKRNKGKIMVNPTLQIHKAISKKV